MDFFSLHDKMLLPKQFGFWHTLLPLFFPSPLTCGKGTGHKPDDCFGEGGEYSGKAAASSLPFTFPRASWCPRLDRTGYVYHMNTFSYFVIPGYIPDTHWVREWKHSCTSGHIGRKSMSDLCYDLQTCKRKTFIPRQRIRKKYCVSVLTASVAKSYVS